MSGIFLNVLTALKNIGNFYVRIQPPNVEQQLQGSGVMPSYRVDYVKLKHKPRAVTIWDLPESVLVCILKGLHIRDLLSFRSTHSYFCNVTDNNISLWTNLSFADSWPSEKTLHHFVKAAERRNLEAVVKLAVAYLYKEGITSEDSSKAWKEAAHYLCQAESLTPKTFPFFWIFIRPPWSPDGPCGKLQTFHHIKEILESQDLPDVTFGAALILKLQRLALQGESKAEEEKYFKKAVEQRSAAASFFCHMDAIAVNEPDKGKELEKVRLLREIASSDILEAKLNLIRYYTQGLYGGVSKDKAQEYVQDFFLSSEPSGIHAIFSGSRTSDISRYILIDWLVEVVGMKDFSAHVLYFAVSLFDRFLQLRRVQRSQVQLLGVAAIVVSSRFLGFEILTIREAAWLTDNSYTYHDVVRMMGELVATLGGNLRALTIQDYTKVLLSIVNETGYAGVLTEYISMLCLLQAEMGQYSPAEIAASCMLLTRILLSQSEAWPAVLREWTGFTQDYLSLCTYHIYNKCLLEGSEMDYRDTKLQAVKTRYADPLRYSVSNHELIGHKELCRRLGVTKLVTHGKDTKAIKFRNTDELIMSPHPVLRSDYHHSIDEAWMDRDSAATPPINNAYATEEGISGYDGDWEYESDDSCDKSEAMFEMNEDSVDLDMIQAFLPEESKDWDVCSESHIDDDSFGDGESVVPNCQNVKDDGTSEAENKITCLSSMCQSGAILSCHSSLSSPSACISNCSCKKSYGSTTVSSLTISSPSLICSSLGSFSFESTFSASLPSLSQGNVRTCIPCGSISFAPKVLGQNKKPCSINCDILPHNPLRDDTSYPLCSSKSDVNSEQCHLQNAQSSQDLISTSFVSSKNTTAPTCLQSLQCKESESALEDKHSSLELNNNVCHQISVMNNQQCPSADLSSNKQSSNDHSSSRSQGIIVHYSENVFTSNHNQFKGSNDFHHNKSDTILSMDTVPDQSSFSQYTVTEARNQPTQHNHIDQDNNVLDSYKSTPPAYFVADKLHSQGVDLQCVRRYDAISMPATPESAPDLQKLDSRASGLVRSNDTFTYNTMSEVSSPGVTSKRARLEYSDQQPVSGDPGAKQSGLSFGLDICDKYEDGIMPDMPLTLSENDCAFPANSRLTLKRKSYY